MGLGVFGWLAVLGLKRSPWFLAVGIAGHGIIWDVSHLTSAYIPSWYPVMCLLVDVGLGLYTAARIPGWREQGAFHRPPTPNPEEGPCAFRGPGKPATVGSGR